MSYVDKHLLPDETVVFRTKLNWIAYFKGTGILLLGFFILGFAPTLGSFVMLIGLISIGLNYLKINASEFAVTNKRVLVKVGILKTSSLETMLNRVEGIHVEQGVIGKILNSGSIVIRGVGGTASPFPNIDRPFEFRQAVNSQIASLI